jgi:SAM-dependent methyltransferase
MIKTENKMGTTFTSVFDSISKAYIEFAAQDFNPTLELGAGRGVTAAELVKKRKYFQNNTLVIVNDLSKKHLADAIKEHPYLKCRMVKMLPRAFPEELDFPGAFFNSILAVRFFQFLTPEQWITGFEKIFNWLKPGGRFYVVTGSYFTAYQMNNIESIEKKKLEGVEWPACFKTGRDAYGPNSLVISNITLVDREILERELKRVGFKVLYNEYQDIGKYLPSNFCIDGRGLIGAIAIK